MDNVSTALRGDADYVRPDENIEVKTSRFVAKTRAPVLENLKIAISGANIGEIYPKAADIPDIFAGGQLVLVGRYTGASDHAKITLTGDANGKPQTYDIGGNFPAVDTKSDFLPRLWATRKIGYLMDEARLRTDDAAKKEIVEQVVALSREFGVLTPYTALFVPEPETDNRLVPLAVADATVRLEKDQSVTVFSRKATDAFGSTSRDRGGFGGGNSLQLDKVRSGEAAVNTSQASRSQRNAAQYGNAQYYAVQAGAGRQSSENLARRVQNVASRTFYQIGTVWTDSAYDTKKQKEVVKVKLYSNAYFALTKRNANLAKWASLGENVLVAANAKQAVQFGETGKDTLTESEITVLAGG